MAKAADTNEPRGWVKWVLGAGGTLMLITLTGVGGMMIDRQSDTEAAVDALTIEIGDKIELEVDPVFSGHQLAIEQQLSDQSEQIGELDTRQRTILTDVEHIKTEIEYIGGDISEIKTLLRDR